MIVFNRIVEALPKHPTKKYGRRYLSQIKRYVIHHSASMNFSVHQAAKYHIEKGWPGIGYTIWIGLDAQAYLTNDLDTICYGVANNNTACLSICLEGNWVDHKPPQHMLCKLDETIQKLDNILGQKPIDVHRTFVNTQCPGDGLAKYIKEKYPRPAGLKISTWSIASFFKRLFRRKDKDHCDLS